MPAATPISSTIPDAPIVPPVDGEVAVLLPNDEAGCDGGVSLVPRDALVLAVVVCGHPLHHQRRLVRQRVDLLVLDVKLGRLVHVQHLPGPGPVELGPGGGLSSARQASPFPEAGRRTQHYRRLSGSDVPDDERIGRPSLVQVYDMDIGLPVATMATVSGSPSAPTTVDDGGGLNFGGSAKDGTKKKEGERKRSSDETYPPQRPGFDELFMPARKGRTRVAYRERLC
uniref:Uncharacterized protein n=1 Tax=Anopheles atroparvus TaxID=41427 RepID=A0A182JF79_ANOAO